MRKRSGPKIAQLIVRCALWQKKSNVMVFTASEILMWKTHRVSESCCQDVVGTDLVFSRLWSDVVTVFSRHVYTDGLSLMPEHSASASA